MVAYTKNDDNSINILGGSNSLDTLHKILPNQEFEVFDGEPFEFNGKYYLSESDVSEADKKTKETEEKRAELIRQYESDKAVLMQYITEAVAYGDDTDELREELLALDEKFDNDMAELKGGE